MADRSRDSFQTRSELSVGSRKYTYFSLPKFAAKTGKEDVWDALAILIEEIIAGEQSQVRIEVHTTTSLVVVETDWRRNR